MSDENAKLAEALKAAMERKYHSLQAGQVDGKAILTNGWQLIALNRDLGLGEWSGSVPLPKVLALLERAALPADAPTVRLADLLAFAVPSSGPCGRCKGKGTIVGECDTCYGNGTYECECNCGRNTHDVDCEDCDGKGNADENCPDCNAGPYRSRPAAIMGALFNMNLLAPMLALIPATEAHIAVMPENDGKALHLWGECWRYMLMALRDAPKDEPALDLQPAGEAGMSGRK